MAAVTRKWVVAAALNGGRLDGTNGVEEVTGQCENLESLEHDAESLVAAVLDSDPDYVDIRWDTSNRAVEICRDRMIRAAEIRRRIGELWSEYIDRIPHTSNVASDTDLRRPRWLGSSNLTGSSNVGNISPRSTGGGFCPVADSEVVEVAVEGGP